MYKRILIICLMTMLVASQGVFATSNSINDDVCAYLTDDQGNTVNLDINITQNKANTRSGHASEFSTNEESLTAQVILTPALLSRDALSNIQQANTSASTRGSLNDGAWDSTENVYVETTIFFDKKTKSNKSYYKLTKVSYELTNHNYDGRIQIVSQNMSMYCRGPQSLDVNGNSAGTTNQNKTKVITNTSGSISTGFTKYALMDANVSSIGATYVVEIKRNSGSWYLTFVNNR